MAVDKAISMIGIAMKAGAICSGEFACEQAIKSGQAHLCIVASDASDNTKKAFHNSCDFYRVKYIEYSTKESLGHGIGKEYRASIVVCDERLSQSIIDKITNS